MPSQTFTIKLPFKKKWRYRMHDKYFEKLKFKFVRWWDSNFPGKYCWADCVSWSFSPDRWNPFKIESSRGCEIESKTDGVYKMCYCGGWKEGVCFAKLPKTEQEKIISERAIDNSIMDELPF